MILGIHSNKGPSVEGDQDAKTTDQAILRDVKKYGINTSQIFTHNPRTGAKIAMNYDDVAKVGEEIKILVHGPYNLSRVFLIDENELKSQLKILEVQFKAAQAVGSSGIVFHISKSTAENTARVIKTILPLAEQYGVGIIVESIACIPAKDRTYESTKLMNEVDALLKKHPLDRFWSWCIDTAHIWSMGVDIKTKENFASWLNTIKRPEKVSTFHLNGSSANFHSGKDKHEIPFTDVDKIWHKVEPKKSGVAALVEFAIKHNCITILEMNRGTSSDLQKCIQTIFGLEKKIGGKPADQIEAKEEDEDRRPDLVEDEDRRPENLEDPENSDEIASECSCDEENATVEN